MNQMAERLTMKINLEWTCSMQWSLLMLCNINNIWLHPNMMKKLSRYWKCSLAQNRVEQIWIFFLVTCCTLSDSRFCKSDTLAIMILLKGELSNSIKKKNLSPDRNQTHDLLNTGVQEVMGLILARDSEFFLCPTLV